MFRCPTCVGILTEPEVASCPHCGQRFGRRKRPVELGQEHRITTRMSAVEHAMLERRSHTMHVSKGETAPADIPPLVEPERPERTIDLTGGDDVDLAASDAARDATEHPTAPPEPEPTGGASAKPPFER